MTTPSGFTIPHEVKQAGQKGLGVFTTAPVRTGTLVWRFVPGAFTVHDEAGLARALTGLTQEQVVYEITHMFGFADLPGHVIRIHDDGVLINHADDANLATNFAATSRPSPPEGSDWTVQSVEQALLRDRYAMLALRDIPAGAELTTNYGADVSDPPFLEALFDAHNVSEDYF